MSVVVAGTGVTKFGFSANTSRELVALAVGAALEDAECAASLGSGGLDPSIGLAVVGNAAAGILTGQEMIRAHTSLATSRLAGIAAMSVENACASSSSALMVGQMAIESGMHDVVVVVGVEKMSGPDRTLPNHALVTAMDIEIDPHSPDSPVFMRHYASEAQRYMRQTGATTRDFAAVTAKNLLNGSMNWMAQHRTPLDVDEILAARMISDPLTRPMCSSIADGAAAVVLMASKTAERLGVRAPRILSMAVASGRHDARSDGPTVVETAARQAFERASLGPEDVDFAEVHDAAAPAELELVERLGLAPTGSGPGLIRSGSLSIHGSMPVNPSGGLISRGHPIGATGLAQIVEVADQLRGRCGSRQVGGARIGITENAGGLMGAAPAVCVVSLLGAP